MLLFHYEEPWMKKNEEEDFGFPMGRHDGAEICELVGNKSYYWKMLDYI